MVRRALLGGLVVALAACAGRPPDGAPADGLVDLWAAVPLGMAALAGADVPAVCDDPFGTWFEDFGVRGLACAADQKVPLGLAARRAPGPVWASGPHGIDGSRLALDLRAPRAFGHYDPAFVRWAVANGVPQGATARRLAGPVYEAHVRRLARIYWLAHQDLAAEGFPGRLPVGGPADYGAYLDGGPVPDGMAGYEGGVSVFLLFDDRSQPIADAVTVPGTNAWEARYEANTALGFWVRRRADGTDALFQHGLRDLLAAFDGAWLVAHGG